MSILSSTNSGKDFIKITKEILLKRGFVISRAVKNSYFKPIKGKYLEIHYDTNNGKFVNRHFSETIEIKTIKQLIILEDYYNTISEAPFWKFTNALNAVKNEFGVTLE